MRTPKFSRPLTMAVITLLMASVAVVVPQRPQGEESLGQFGFENRQLNRRSQALAIIREKIKGERVEASGKARGPAQEDYENRALPRSRVAYEQAIGAGNAFDAVQQRGAAPEAANAWQLLGPSVGYVPGQVTYTDRETTVSGRVTALAIAPVCVPGNCVLYLAAAGGGVWRTQDALAITAQWTSISQGMRSNSIGSITIDPNDATGKTVYVGTGEENGSSDSEAGIGLYKSTDGGDSWKLVLGSVSVAKDRSIGAVAIDPRNPRHILIGTAVARHGSSSVNGGRWTPPAAPVVGLYESTNGGLSFQLVFSRPSDVPDPTIVGGGDYFRGGVTNVVFDRTGLSFGSPARVYLSVFDYGVYRSTGSGGYEQIFASAGGGSPDNSIGARTEFALAVKNGKSRMYVGDTDGNTPADFYRVDDVNVPAAVLTNGTTNPGWLKLSNPTPGTPGFASYNFCSGQCSYDMVVASPPGRPDTVWLGGQMQYDEIFTATPPSNGRTVQRSIDAGVSFTDMTNDAQSPPLGMHPDQHALVFAPGQPDIAFAGSDGGIVSTSGTFTDASGQCASRDLSGADLTDCQMWLKAIPTRLYSLNRGLPTLQFQSVSVNPQSPRADILGGTQDNGTWGYNGDRSAWLETVGGDGGQSGIDAVNPAIRVHSYYAPQHDVNFHGDDPSGWNWISDPLLASGERASFYVPLRQDPVVGGTIFDGLQHVWRTQDSGGPHAYLDQNCNEYTGAFAPGTTCGDWVPIGQDLTAGDASDKGGQYVVAIERARSDTGTLWAATRVGRLWISKNANASDPASVQFTRLDTPNTPNRFVSGIAIDPGNPNRAWVSFSGYNAYTPATPGHVFDVRYNPATGTATWTDISNDLGDMPVTGIVRDDRTGTLYISTDFGVLRLLRGSSNWLPTDRGLPRVAVYGLTIDSRSRVLYAATHGRSVWQYNLP